MVGVAAETPCGEGGCELDDKVGSQDVRGKGTRESRRAEHKKKGDKLTAGSSPG